MTFEYCETCRRVTFGSYFPAATPAMKAFLCSECYAITYIDRYGQELCDEAWQNDISLRNEAVKLQRKVYS
jgi:hypothetical protein